MTERDHTLDVDTYRRRLETRQHELLALVASAQEAQPDAEPSTAFDQHGTAVHAPCALIARYEDALTSVRKALDAIDAGTFGVCQQCHEPISVDRLESAPDTNVCFWCSNR